MNTVQVFVRPFARIYRILPPWMRRGVWALFILMVLQAIADMLAISVFTLFFSSISRPDYIRNLDFVTWLCGRSPSMADIFTDPRRVILWVSVMTIFFIVVKNILSALVMWKSAMMGEHVAAHVGNTIMRRFLHMPYSWHLSSQNSQALTCMQWRFSLGHMLNNLLCAYSNLITVTLLFLLLAYYEPGVTMSSVVVMSVTSFLTFFLLKKRVDAASVAAASAQAQENTAVMTAIGGVRECIIYQRQSTFLNAIASHVCAGMRPRTFLSISSTVPTWTLESAGFLLIWFVVFLLIRVENAEIGTIATSVVFLAFTAWRVLPSLNRVVGSVVSIRGLQGTAMPCLEYFETLTARAPESVLEPAPDFRISHEIVFDHVSYRYPGAERDALTDVCCRIPMGATLGLVGRSGAGKSTFINILSGLLTPTSGRLLVDGRELNPAELSAFRKQIGYVPQSPYLLAGTIAQNVAFSDWGKELDIPRVQQACRDAAIDFLGPDCADTERTISPNGSGLSGGQMQRVSIARALYTQPSLLIFDEATSALDQASEAMVQETIVKAQGQHTCVIAAHRLSTLEVCDTVVLLEDGRVEAFGKADSVINQYVTDCVNADGAVAA